MKTVKGGYILYINCKLIYLKHAMKLPNYIFCGLVPASFISIVIEIAWLGAVAVRVLSSVKAISFEIHRSAIFPGF